MQRQCKRCNNLFKAVGKGSKICNNCRIIIPKKIRKKHSPNKHTIDPKKLMALKKKLDKMSYAEAL